MNASPWGSSSSQSSSSYSNQQSSQVVQAFQPVLGLLGQMQGAISGGSMTQAAASNYVNQLVSQLQPALNGINACGCFGSVWLLRCYLVPESMLMNVILYPISRLLDR